MKASNSPVNVLPSLQLASKEPRETPMEPSGLEVSKSPLPPLAHGPAFESVQGRARLPSQTQRPQGLEPPAIQHPTLPTLPCIPRIREPVNSECPPDFHGRLSMPLQPFCAPVSFQEPTQPCVNVDCAGPRLPPPSSDSSGSSLVLTVQNTSPKSHSALQLRGLDSFQGATQRSTLSPNALRRTAAFEQHLPFTCTSDSPYPTMCPRPPSLPRKQADFFVEMPSTLQVPCNTPHHPRHLSCPPREMASPSVVPPFAPVVDVTLPSRMEVEPFGGFCMMQTSGIQRKKLLQTQGLEVLQSQGVRGLSPPFTTSHYCPGQAACSHFSTDVFLEVPRPLVYCAPLQPRTVVVQEPTRVEHVFIDIPSTSLVPVQAEKPTKADKTDRHQQTDTVTKDEGTHREQQTEKPEGTHREQQTEKPEGTHQEQQTEKPETGKPEGTHREQQTEKPEGTHREQQTEKPEGTHQEQQTEKPETGKPEGTHREQQTEKPEGTHREQQTEKPEGTHQEQQTEKPEGTHQEQQTEKPETGKPEGTHREQQTEKPEGTHQEQQTEKPETEKPEGTHREQQTEKPEGTHQEQQTEKPEGTHQEQQTNTVTKDEGTQWEQQTENGKLKVNKPEEDNSLSPSHAAGYLTSTFKCQSWKKGPQDSLVESDRQQGEYAFFYKEWQHQLESGQNGRGKWGGAGAGPSDGEPDGKANSESSQGRKNSKGSKRSKPRQPTPGPGHYNPEDPAVRGRIPGRVPGHPKLRRDPDIRL